MKEGIEAMSGFVAPSGEATKLSIEKSLDEVGCEPDFLESCLEEIDQSQRSTGSEQLVELH